MEWYISIFIKVHYANIRFNYTNEYYSDLSTLIFDPIKRITYTCCIYNVCIKAEVLQLLTFSIFNAPAQQNKRACGTPYPGQPPYWIYLRANLIPTQPFVLTHNACSADLKYISWIE